MGQEVREEEPVAERGQRLRGPAFGDMSFPVTSTRYRLGCGLGACPLTQEPAMSALSQGLSSVRHGIGPSCAYS